MKLAYGFLAALLLASAQASAAPRVNISDFANEQLQGWERKSFEGTTQYQVAQEGNLSILKATSRDAASGVAKRMRVDLQQTPFLNWTWRIGNQLQGVNEQSKSGDDYPARLYVVVDGGLIPWNSKAVNYVWASTSARGQSWGNAFLPNNAKMIAVRGAQDKPGGWVREKRNVRADFKRLFGKDIRYIDAVAIMTDTDNSGQQASAAYADVFFSAQ